MKQKITAWILPWVAEILTRTQYATWKSRVLDRLTEYVERDNEQ